MNSFVGTMLAVAIVLVIVRVEVMNLRVENLERHCPQQKKERLRVYKVTADLGRDHSVGGSTNITSSSLR